MVKVSNPWRNNGQMTASRRSSGPAAPAGAGETRGADSERRSGGAGGGGKKGEEEEEEEEEEEWRSAIFILYLYLYNIYIYSFTSF